MLRNYFKISFRSLLKSKVFVLINVMGMASALACCIVAYLNHKYAFGFDSDQENIDSIYRVDSERVYQGDSTKFGYVPLPLGNIIRENIPEAVVIRFHTTGGTIRIKEDLFNTNFRYVDSNFFDVFTFPLLLGRKEELSDRSKVFISYNMARRIFGTDNPIGKQITQVLDSSYREYVIAGVIDQMQDNSSFDGYQIITHWDNYKGTYPWVDENYWGDVSTVFLKLDDKRKIPGIERQLQHYVEPQNRAREDFKIARYFIEPFKGMAYRARAENVRSFLRRGIPIPATTIPSIMAILILLIACFNFTNTSIAISNRRLKEIGLRKVMGGVQRQLVIQFLLENIGLCLLALIIALPFADYLAQLYSQLFPFVELQLDYSNNLGFFAFLSLLLIVAGIAAGAYPAFYISGFEPTSILRGTTKFKGAGVLPRILLGLQYFISIMAIVMGLAFVQNSKYQDELDLGITKRGIIYTRLNNFNEFEVYKNSLEGNPDIEIIGGSEYQFFNGMRNDPVRSGDLEIESNIMGAGDGYLEAMGIKLTSGRPFITHSETDRRESILVSETFARSMGWKEPVGQRVVWGDTTSLYVIGTVKDVLMAGFGSPPNPLMIRYVPENDYRYLTVKTSPEKSAVVNEFLKKKWNEIFTNKLYNGEFLSDNLEGNIEVNDNATKVFFFLGLIATILSSTGLFTLVSLNIIKRMKEIGVRKVLGASILNIASTLNKNFIIILAISMIAGAFLGSVFCDKLLSQVWTYHIPMNFFSPTLGVILMLSISLVTVGYKVYSAATLNPVKTLRSE